METVDPIDELLSEAEPIKVAILGSTGSIGRQALDVVRAYPDRFELVALAAGSDAGTLLSQAKEFAVGMVGLRSGVISAPPGVKVIDGDGAAEEVAANSQAQVVLNAVVGAAGLKATLATIRSNKTLALANKESLVAAGELVMAKASPGQIRPVDSEHSALWQLLEGISRADHVRRVRLTGSGGPFRGRSVADLADVTVAEALAHPVWKMGKKITVDSATLMNKGLEVIEAHFLFGFTYDEIEVMIHPQGLIHALAETVDGSVFAHAALPDMRLPIQIALAWPERLVPPESHRLDFTQTKITFEPPDVETFRCLSLAYEAGRRGDTYPAVLNASNEIAVQSFLSENLDFLGIPSVVERVLEEHNSSEASLEGVLEADAWARSRAVELIASLERKR